MNFTASIACLNKTVLSYQEPDSLNFILSAFLFPFVCVAGVAGAVINLIVFNSKGMKTKTNCFLSSMALTDCCFFVAMFSMNVIVYEYFAKFDAFVAIFYTMKMPLNALANWFSSSSIWLAVMVTFERLIAIRTPLHAHLVWQRYKPKYVIAAICVLLFLLQIYTVVHITASVLPDCADHSKIVYFLYIIKPQDNIVLYKYVLYSLVIVPLLTVTLPVILLVLFNALLLYYLRSNRNELRRLGSLTTTKCEWRVTCTVFCIVISMLIFNVPSVIYYWVSTLFGAASKSLPFLLNFLIVVSKALNFFLYCATSSAFRTRLVKIFSGRTKYSLKKSTKRSNEIYFPMINCSKNANTKGTKVLKRCVHFKSDPTSLPLTGQQSPGAPHSSDIML